MEEQDDIWWYICTICYAAFTEDIKLRTHKRIVHQSTKNANKILILSQGGDLEPKIVLTHCLPNSANIGSFVLHTHSSSVTKNKRNPIEEVDINYSLSPDTDHWLDPLLDIEESHEVDNDNEIETKYSPFSLAKYENTQLPLPEDKDPREDSDAIIGNKRILRPRICIPTVINLSDGGHEQENKNILENDDDYSDGSTSSESVALNGEEDSDWASEKRCARRSLNRRRISDDSQQPAIVQESESEPNVTESTTKRCYKCIKCQKSYSGKRCLRNHLKKKHGPAQSQYQLKLECPICQKVFTRKNSLGNHQKYAHSDKTYMCSICGAEFKNELIMKKHERQHDQSNRTFLCEICSRGFFSKDKLKNHMQTHISTSERQIMCPVCGVMLLSETGLKNHIRNAHEECRHKCDKCDATFRTAHRLRWHEAKHTASRNVSCPKCPKTYKTDLQLKDHIKRVHRKIKQAFICKVCHKEFPGVRSLCQHELEVHDFQRRGAKKFQCRFCNKKFHISATLEQHEVMHTNERNYECKTCGKKFKLPTHLRTHSFTHLLYEELPHVCDLCGKRFGVPAQLRSHKQRIHEDKINNGDQDVEENKPNVEVE